MHSKNLFCRVLPGAALLTLLWAFGAGAAFAGDGGNDEDGGDGAAFDFAELASAFQPHCARVYIHARSADGDMPGVGGFDADINHERPTPVGGYWWDDTHVVIPDQGLQDRFIRAIEAGPADADALYPARVAGRFIRLQAVLLEVLPGPDGGRPDAVPLEFVDGDVNETLSLSYVWDEGEWRVKADSGLGASSRSDSGVEMIEIAHEGVLVDAGGFVLGLAFGDRVVVDRDEDVIPYWYGRETAYSPLVSADEAEKSADDLRRRLAESVLECRFAVRVKVEDGEEEEDGSDSWSPDGEGEEPAGGNPAEARAAGLVVGRRLLLAPVALSPESVRRIEEISVVLPGGREIGASFVGAFRDYMAVVVETDEDLPVRNLPPGFADLNPMAAPGGEEGGRPAPLRESIQRWRIDYLLGRRREEADCDRWLGTFRGFRGDAVVLTGMNEEDGHLAFDIDGNLVAVALTPRLINSRDRARGTAFAASPGFRPLDFLRRKLREEGAFDPDMVPLDGDEGRRLVDFGVEFQSLDANTAGLFHVSRETRGGRIGVMVSHVYPGSIADRLGIREKDVLLRLFIEGRREPMELRADGFSHGFDMDMSSDSLRSFLRFMPPPWPSRDNVVSSLLTGAGAGRRATVEYVRDGETRGAEFVTAYGEPDYRSARREKFAALGMTVRPVTFETARYFGRADRSGVIVSRVEDGGRSSVAGLHKYLLITHVNGETVAGLEDFAGKVRPFEEGTAPSVEFTVDDFGKTHLVKME